MGCHDYDRFRGPPPGEGLDLAAADLAVADPAAVDLAGADLAGCPPAQNDAPTGCVVTYFNAGAPKGWAEVLSSPGGIVTSAACGMLRVQVPAGANHDFWSVSLGSYRLERTEPVVGPVQVFARIDARLDTVEQLVGLYLREGTRYIGAEAHFGGGVAGLHEEANIFIEGLGQYEMGDVRSLAQTGSFRHMIARPKSGIYNWVIGTNGGISQSSAPDAPAYTVGITVGNAGSASTSAPALDAYIQWVAICPAL